VFDEGDEWGRRWASEAQVSSVVEMLGSRISQIRCERFFFLFQKGAKNRRKQRLRAVWNKRLGGSIEHKSTCIFGTDMKLALDLSRCGYEDIREKAGLIDVTIDCAFWLKTARAAAYSNLNLHCEGKP